MSWPGITPTAGFGTPVGRTLLINCGKLVNWETTCLMERQKRHTLGPEWSNYIDISSLGSDISDGSFSSERSDLSKVYWTRTEQGFRPQWTVSNGVFLKVHPEAAIEKKQKISAEVNSPRTQDRMRRGTCSHSEYITKFRWSHQNFREVYSRRLESYISSIINISISTAHWQAFRPWLAYADMTVILKFKFTTNVVADR